MKLDSIETRFCAQYCCSISIDPKYTSHCSNPKILNKSKFKETEEIKNKIQSCFTERSRQLYMIQFFFLALLVKDRRCFRLPTTLEQSLQLLYFAPSYNIYDRQYKIAFKFKVIAQIASYQANSDRQNPQNQQRILQNKGQTITVSLR